MRGVAEAQADAVAERVARDDNDVRADADIDRVERDDSERVPVAERVEDIVSDADADTDAHACKENVAAAETLSLIDALDDGESRGDVDTDALGDTDGVSDGDVDDDRVAAGLGVADAHVLTDGDVSAEKLPLVDALDDGEFRGDADDDELPDIDADAEDEVDDDPDAEGLCVADELGVEVAAPDRVAVTETGVYFSGKGVCDAAGPTVIFKRAGWKVSTDTPAGRRQGFAATARETLPKERKERVETFTREEATLMSR
jgi:hypothetical protein